MSAFDWERFLRQWSQEILESMSSEQLAQLPATVIESGWLGYPGATEEQVCQAESRLGVKLPPSYRDFLQVTNGWRQTTPFIRKLWSTEGIERFADRHQKWIDAFTHQHENAQVSFDYAIELDELWEPPSVADAEYFVYGEDQDCSKLRVEYLKTAIEISDVGEAAIYLLNPQVVTEDGEWEAWFFGDWLPGADRYRSFREMMEAEYQNFLELHDSESASDPAPVESESRLPAVSLSPSTASSTPERSPEEPSSQDGVTAPANLTREPEPVMWRSLKRLTVEFQTRPRGEHLEYRTVTTAEGEQTSTWPGLGGRELRQWLQQQLVDAIHHPVEPEAASTQATSPALLSAASAPLNPSRPVLNLTLEIDQLVIRQDSRFTTPIIIKPADPKPAKRTGYASLNSRQTFSLEVSFNLAGQSPADLPGRSVTYQAQFHAQNRLTGQWTALGETRPGNLVCDRQIYTAQLFGQTLAPGMYRLQILTTLRGATVALKSFELPLLNVV